VAVRSVEDAAEGVLAAAPAPHGPEWRSDYQPGRLEGELQLLSHALREMESLLTEQNSETSMHREFQTAQSALQKAIGSLGPLCRKKPEGAHRADELRAHCDVLLQQVKPMDSAPAAAQTAMGLVSSGPVASNVSGTSNPSALSPSRSQGIINTASNSFTNIQEVTAPSNIGEAIARGLRLYFSGLSYHAPAAVLTWLAVEGWVPTCCERDGMAQIMAVVLGWVFYAGGAALASGRWNESWFVYFMRRPGAFLDAVGMGLWLGLPAWLWLPFGAKAESSWMLSLGLGGEGASQFMKSWSTLPETRGVAIVIAALLWLGLWPWLVSAGVRHPAKANRQRGDAPWLPSIPTAWRLVRNSGSLINAALPLAAWISGWGALWIWLRLEVTQSPTEIWLWDASFYGWFLPMLACTCYAFAEMQHGKSPTTSSNTH
jgi:hypothetical protein